LDHKLQHLEQEKRAIGKDIIEDLKQTWRTSQAKEKRLEWYLNNPDALKHELPGRLGDDDPRLGPSSLQKFAGEDLDAGVRKKMQLEQQCSWLEQQLGEKHARAGAEADVDQAWTSLVSAQVEHMKRVADAQSQARKENTMHNLKCNDAVLMQTMDRKQREEAELAEANQTDQFNTYNSKLLVECPSTALHATNPNRRRMDHYKGMTPEETQATIGFWPHQHAEREAKKEAEKQDDIAYAQYTATIRKELGRKAAEIEAFRADQRKAVQHTLLKQRTEKAERDKTGKGSLAPSQKFFDQFGTSHR